MEQLISLPLCTGALGEYRDWADLEQEIAGLGCDGVEGIWGGEDLDIQIPAGLVKGYHLTFYPDWLDFYQEDDAALTRKFGSLEAAGRFYGGLGRACLMEQYRADLERAAKLGAEYVVFHVSDVSVEEGYTYRWLHGDGQVIDAAVEVVNDLLDGRAWPFTFLVENQWWPGFTFTSPRLTARLLDGIHHSRKGIMLDIGHLMNTNQTLSAQAEGAEYVRMMLDRHGSLARYIRGIHLHQSLSAGYVSAHTGYLPKDLPEDYMDRFAVSYGHILKIDQHRPWTDPAILPVLERIAPAYLTHELSARDRASRAAAVKAQCALLQPLHLK